MGQIKNIKLHIVTDIKCSSNSMGISRDSFHKRRATGGRVKPLTKKRKHCLGRPSAHTKLGQKSIHTVRCRGGNLKHRAMRLDAGNYSWGSESISRKTRILDVMYNASNNELVRTKTLVKNAVVQIDATPFNQWDERRVTKLVKWRMILSPNQDLIIFNARLTPENLEQSWTNIWKISSQVDVC